MGSAVAQMVWRDVVGKRWITCVVWQIAMSSVVWLLSESFLRQLSRPWATNADDSAVVFPFLWAGMRFIIFQVSQGFFLMGQTFICDPEERDAASIGDLAGGLLNILIGIAIGRSRDDSTKIGYRELTDRIRTTGDYLSFALMTAISGFLAFFSTLSSPPLPVQTSSTLEISIRGFALGIMYSGLQFYNRNLNLTFPIVQRGLFFGLKMGIPSALSNSLKLAFLLLPAGEILSVTSVPSVDPAAKSGLFVAQDGSSSILWRQTVFVLGSFFTLFSWEFGHHVVRVLQTKHHIFAPPLGSAAAEADSADMLLLVLEDPEISSLVQYHAYHDLCIVSETNVDTWRRAAFFGETGDSYRRLITSCLKRLDNLTIRLAQHLEGFQAEKGVDFLKQQMQAPQFESQPIPAKGAYTKSQFRDFQLCTWSARIVASLTACSRFEDRYGVAQLHGCNVDVVSSLLSCLLVVEVYLGRRSSAAGVSFVPNSIKWTVPSRGAFMDPGKKQGTMLGKRTQLHKKAYAMADVLRTSLYQIVSVFGDEMLEVGATNSGYTVVEKDWLSRKKPLFGAHEMHLQKIGMFLDYSIA